MPRVGLEPTHLAAGDFESPASTNFATWAVSGNWNYTNIADIVKHFIGENVFFIVFKWKNIYIHDEFPKLKINIGKIFAFQSIK